MVRGVMSAPIDSLVAVDVEAALLGAMLIDNVLIDQFADKLAVPDFHEPVHSRIYSALLKFRSKGAVASPITLRPVFQNDPSALGGDYLAKLADSPALTVGAPDFAAQLTMLASRRRARDAAKAALERLEKDWDAPLAEILGPIHDVALSGAHVDEAPARSAGDMVGLVRARRARLAAGTSTVGAKNRLIPELDDILGPLEAGMYVCLAGRPGMGKSATAGSAALGYALGGHATLYLQGEMTEDVQAMRVVSDASHAFGRGIAHKNIRLNTLNAGEDNWLGRVEEKLALLPLTYRAIGRKTIRQVESLIARECAFRAAQGQKLEVVFLDQLSFIDAQDEQGRLIDDDRKRMNAVSAAIPGIAQRLGVAIFALAQLSRAVEGRVNKRPMLSDLKETGKLEEDADFVLFVYREEYYLKDQKPKTDKGEKGGMTLEDWSTEMEIARGKLDLIAGKARHDETKTRTVRFKGEFYAVRGASINHDDEEGAQGFDFDALAQAMDQFGGHGQ